MVRTVGVASSSRKVQGGGRQGRIGEQQIGSGEGLARALPATAGRLRVAGISEKK